MLPRQQPVEQSRISNNRVRRHSLRTLTEHTRDTPSPQQAQQTEPLRASLRLDFTSGRHREFGALEVVGARRGRCRGARAGAGSHDAPSISALRLVDASARGCVEFPSRRRFRPRRDRRVSRRMPARRRPGGVARRASGRLLRQPRQPQGRGRGRAMTESASLRLRADTPRSGPPRRRFPATPTPTVAHSPRSSWTDCIASSRSRIADSKAVNPGGLGNNDHGSDSPGPRAGSDAAITQIVASRPMLPVSPLGTVGAARVRVRMNCHTGRG